MFNLLKLSLCMYVFVQCMCVCVCLGALVAICTCCNYFNWRMMHEDIELMILNSF